MKQLAGLLLVVAACGGSDPADVSGNYTVALTNRDNGCMIANWTEGESSSGVAVTITQDGSNATASVEAGAGFILDVALGSHVYTGSVDGHAVFLELFGTRGQQNGNCSFTFNSDIDATLIGDTLSGKIEYRAATNSNPDCAALEGCVSFQEFNGARPPR